MNQWSTFLQHLETLFGSPTLNEWVKPLKVVNFDARNLYLRADNQFQIAWFNEHIKELAKEHLITSSGRAIKVHIICDDEKEVKVKQEDTQEISPLFKPDFCDPSFTFDSFFTGGKTELSYQILESLLRIKQDEATSSANERHNPIFIYGPSSSGKTHLLTASAHILESLGLKVFYVHALTFSSHVVRAFRGSLLHEFRQTYRNVDVLIIDDIHLLKRKLSSQEELFHTFNWLHTRKKLILLSSNTMPSHLEDIEERLISRFEWGISLALERPAKQAMKQILASKASDLHLHLTPKLSSWLLDTLTSPGTLAAALSTLALHHHKATPIEQDLAEFYLKDLILLEKSKTLTLDTIINQVASYYGIKNDDILGKSQNKEASLPRQVSMYLCREKMKTPYLQLGSFFKRDHSTVMTSVKSIKNKIKQKEPALLTAIDKISQALI